ncbi:glycosyltransferase [Microbacterium sp. JZ31]|uniref:glycosyltransferase n=1 Tax=Microbacterium sp. JZ31 TaxID=1906274 RepID=UPI0019337709|nr:glycosyltransferase [Microbacterium sp. JZ31]
MKNKRRIALVLLGAAVLTALVIAAVFAEAVAIILLGLLQIAVLLLLVDTRRALSTRIFSAARKLERHLIGNMRGKLSKPAPAPLATAAVVAPMAESEVQRAAQSYGKEIRLIKASLIFDQEWYAAQVGSEFASLDRAIIHYLTRGRRGGFTPHPLFNQQWLVQDRWSAEGQDPLISYVRNEGGLWERSTSPLFDPSKLDAKLKKSDYGPLSAFLRDRGADWPLPYAVDAAFSREGLTLEEARVFLLERLTQWRAIEHAIAPTRGSAEPPQSSRALEQALNVFRRRAETPPLVSVILPTWNRAGSLRAALESITQQSYENWELIVADDGSIDDTALVLEAEAARDPRIKPLLLEHRGVSAARNSALAHARGAYVAFLDSDKVWEPDFLLSMVAFLEVHGHDAGYSVVEVSLNGKSLYRTTPATRESLRVANSIDQTAIVARRSLIDRTGGFDESLLRAVDYDLILSLSELTDLVQVPYVGVRYSEDDQDPNRISEAQSIAWNFYVRDRRRWVDTEIARIEPGLVSIIVDGARGGEDAQAAVANVAEHLGDVEAEIIVVPASTSWIALQSTWLVEFASVADVRVLPMAGGSDRPPLRINNALRSARGELVLVTTADHRFEEGTVADLVSEMEDSDAAAVHPVVLDSRRLISDAGVVYAPDGRDPVGLLAGLPAGWAAWESTAVAVPGASLPLLLRASTVRRITGLNTKLKQLWVDVDMSQRAARDESKPVVLSTSSTVQLREASVFGRREGSEADVRMFAALWPKAPQGSEEAMRAAGVAATFHGFTAISAPKAPSAWTSATWRPRDRQWAERVVDRPSEPLQWSIKTAAPADERAASWGDFHFANSLAAALRSLGHRASVDYGPNAERATANADDVVVNLRGLKDVQLPVGATSLIWVISHPDLVTAKELEAYDIRYAASLSWPRLVAEQWGVDVNPLLQCTDPERFYIDDQLVPEVQDRLLMVGNSRNQYRPAAWQTANAGMPVAIYGNGWEKFVDEKYIAGSYVPNEELRRYYRSAEWALNDHWADMREQGFISNRIFDVLASGGRLLTDDVEGLPELFPADVLPNGVATFSTPLELLAIAETGPAKYYDDDVLRKISDYVRSQHSFLARAGVMVEDVRRLRAQARPR